MASERSLQSWLTYLEAIHPLSMDFKLARIITVYERLSLTPIAPLVITVAGTNGKGSTSTTIANLYKAHDFKVGLFTSPHINRFNERIRINLEEVSDSELIEAFNAIEKAREEITLTYFEFATLAAFYLFKKNHVDVAVLEVGLGGRLDSTNIVDANIAVITPISIDHTAQLGNTITAIAGEKAGIIKAKAKVVTAESEPSISIINKAQSEDASLYIRDEAYHYEILENGAFTYQFENSATLTLPQPNLLGKHQYQNASAAITALYLSGTDVIPEKVEQGLKSVKLEGRFQALTRKNSPRVFLDVTHNPQGATVLKALVEEFVAKSQPKPKVTALLGMLKDKDEQLLVKTLSETVDEWITAPILDERGQSAEILRDKISHLLTKPPHASNSIPKGCEFALSCSQPHDIIIVFGSFHMMAESLNWFKENQYV
ncbi:bifunctional tetrahydrofolate synthase/dihydrofolate synthase [Ignatzschineria rhizosphaerae]|uniref:Dihydrofolate synthase/folylpolyglutamate synthase n=1 Tax=Ignatzschineria rhizosphaerae TaxID=2923279 RepID=A0ABY3X0S3_9GAMM|nr:bifunctional tetrahydrofolate synthase/dihydrofolate synthase [Ignatzschineria rhizosphaerae]UNM96464.1 bifunctional tetrahydrofolate synthase/dihydrofolate synthase [Ignatzschineria rhizosphaerae]